jgi:N-acetylglutamate synthase-like GNAT family acetyltransferase
LYTAARINKLTNEDTVAEITAFYPFREEPRLVGKDMGIAVMNLLLRHCESEGIAAIYTRTTNPAMLQLLGKAGFQNIEGYYLKKI